MPKASFSKRPEAEEDKQEVSTETESANVQLATQNSGVTGFEGEWSAADVQIPLVQILQPGSNLLEEFPNNCGEFLYDKKFSLGNHVRCIFLKLKKQYQEVKDFDETMPQTFDTAEDAKAAGIPVSDMCLATLAIEVPEEDEHSESSMLSHDGKSYLVCQWYLKGRSFNLARTINKDVMTSFQGAALHSRFYDVGSVKKPARGKPFRVPVPRLGDTVPAELVTKLEADGFAG